MKCFVGVTKFGNPLHLFLNFLSKTFVNDTFWLVQRFVLDTILCGRQFWLELPNLVTFDCC